LLALLIVALLLVFLPESACGGSVDVFSASGFATVESVVLADFVVESVSDTEGGVFTVLAVDASEERERDFALILASVEKRP